MRLYVDRECYGERWGLVSFVLPLAVRQDCHGTPGGEPISSIKQLVRVARAAWAISEISKGFVDGRCPVGAGDGSATK
jgi:hypothetical protein